ncbi:N-Dimethylarginine dimethylaminohydrolase [Cyclonatronum proteinivorum]|uniref:arginine deiminase n=1 Tax=Cyclonatronum proteinivorum TaxID=1457365 RepID=A0A345UHV7_9BACT|nr:arginine deiminase-related protein [Cyclonatronum proteinivorum]AXJ00059.1 N-Dimethylarginine dimethylaminohydrolase [Cyclonatronum proteinivorum]
MSSIISHSATLRFRLKDLDTLPEPGRVLMVRPTHFSIDYVINPHMEGQVGKVNKEKAMQQWEQVRDAFAATGKEVVELEGGKNLPDMVFCANQSLPYCNPEGGHEVIMSIMNSPYRQPEVPLIADWYDQQNYERHHLDGEIIPIFEGMGDAIWHPGRRLLWGGHGFRTSKDAYTFISETLNVPVITLALHKSHFYHLDTCFCALNEDSVLIYPKAFEPEGLRLIRSLFKNVIEAPEEEAMDKFACNATCPDGKHVIIQKGAKQTSKALKEAGFEVVEVDTSEFIKSGGSVFCMKLMLW